MRHLLLPKGRSWALIGALAGCTPEGGAEDLVPPASMAPQCEAPGPRDEELTWVDVQAIGTHNSYHVAPAVPLDPSHAYTHPTLDVQLGLGARAFELDVHRTEDGTWEVFHLPVIDPGTTCLSLADCLATLVAWSDAHPCHAPVTVWIEPKDDIDAAADGYDVLTGHLHELHDVLRQGLGDRLFTPDGLRGSHASLRDARLAGWPTLGASRGRFLVALLDEGPHREEVLADHPDLVGSAVFVEASDPADPLSAVAKIDDAVGGGAAERVAEGFLITSNAATGADPDEVAEADYLATLAAGPTHIATDRLVAQPQGDWVATMPEGSPRCHPARVPGGCAPGEVEPVDMAAPNGGG